MKTIKLTVLALILVVQVAFAQKSLTFDLKPKQDVVYFNLDGKVLSYFTDHQDNQADKKKNVDAKDNHINIYMEWLNPLRYKLNWKDTTMTDERDKAVNDFVNLLVGQFGKTLTELNVPAAAQFVSPESKSKGQELDTANITIVEFKDNDIVLLLIQLRSNQRYLTNVPGGEIQRLNAFFKSLKELEELVDKDVSSGVTEVCKKIFGYKTFKEYDDDFQTQVDQVTDMENVFGKADEKRSKVADEIKVLNIGDVLLKAYVTTALTAYLGRVETRLNNDKKLTVKLKPIFDIMRESVKNESHKYSGYFLIRDIDFDDGNKVETRLTITEYEFNAEIADVKKKEDMVTKTMVFRKHDVFNVYATTGIFYGRTTLKGFGVAEDFTVIEDDIERGNAVTAAFLNLELRLSRYFSPVIQLGADPTKRRPYFLLGGGFSIPAARLAITGGALWTWDQKLDKLSLGETVASTTDLEKEIKYTFGFEPKGWYLGIQYKF